LSNGHDDESENKDEASDDDGQTKIPLAPETFEISTETLSKTFTTRAKKPNNDQ
jgi:hypothetical protein